MKIKKLVEEINNNKEKMNNKDCNIDKKFAIFKDQKGDFNVVEIYINIGECFILHSKNQHGEDTRIYEYIFSS